MRVPTVHRQARIVISVFIVTLAGLHLVPMVEEHSRGHQTTWPIMAWGMYRNSQHPPVEALRRRLFAEGPTGRRIPVECWDAGMGNSAFKSTVLGPLARGDSVAARRLAESLAPHLEEPLARLVLERDRYVLVDGKLVVEPQPAAIYVVDSLVGATGR